MNVKGNKILGALIGLSGAVENNRRLDSTDQVVSASLRIMDDVNEHEMDCVVKAIHFEKHRLASSCETCSHPCGNTSDFDFDMADSVSEDIDKLKQEIVKCLVTKAADRYSYGTLTTLPEVVYKALSCIRYNLNPMTYKEVLKELEEW